jgi:ABC-type microcin C transport system permease subunit YejB
MPATFVTTAELRANLGIGSLYSDATVEECCQSAEDLISEYLWHNDAPVVGTALQDNVATLMLANPNAFVTGQLIGWVIS